VFLWLGIAAGLVGCLLWLWPGVSPDFQVLPFAGFSVASVLGWRRWQSDHPATSDQPHLNRRGAQYVGCQSVLIEPIVNGRRRIRLGNASWTVAGPDLPPGATVEVTGADGVVLQVPPIAGADSLASTGRGPSADAAAGCVGCRSD
jgi:inner membrane protein